VDMVTKILWPTNEAMVCRVYVRLSLHQVAFKQVEEVTEEPQDVDQVDQHVVVEEPVEVESPEEEAPRAEVEIEEMPEERVEDEPAGPVDTAEPAAPKPRVAPSRPAEKPHEDESKIAFKPLKKVEKTKVETKEEKKEEVKPKTVKVTKKPEAEETKIDTTLKWVPKKEEAPTEEAPVPREETKPKEKPKVKKAQQAIPKVKPELPKAEIAEPTDYEEPLRELANISARLERGVSVTELNAAYQANEFPALKRKKSQIAILKAVERVGESAVVQQILAQECPTLAPVVVEEVPGGGLENAGFQALLTTLASESHKIEEIITQVQPEDFTDSVIEERFAKIVQDTQELITAPQVGSVQLVKYLLQTSAMKL